MENIPQAPQFNIAPQLPEKNWFGRHMILGYVFLGLILSGTVAAVYWYEYADKELPQNSTQNICIEGTKPEDCNDTVLNGADEPIDWKGYTNTEYGFAINLPLGWKGHTVIDEQWEGWNIDPTKGDNKVIDHGPKIILRHPLWSKENPREDMPIMVFTPQQWQLIEQDKMSVSAAPISPSMLGRNSKYVLALPARYNYDFSTGWEEVDELVRKLNAFEPN